MAADEYVLYGAKGSGSASIDAGLHLAGLPPPIVEAAQWLPESKYAELLEVNPLGQVPTLVLPDGQVLTESAAIHIHLGMAIAAPGVLMPTDPIERARILRGLVFIPANCYSAITILDYPERFLEPAEDATKEALRAGTRKRLHLHWEMFADQFGGGTFLHGDAPGSLDLFAAVVSRWSGTRKHLEEHRPQSQALPKRIDTHPQLAPVFKRHWDH